MILGVLARSAQFVKCASKTALLPRLFAHSALRSRSKTRRLLRSPNGPGGVPPWRTRCSVRRIASPPPARMRRSLPCGEDCLRACAFSVMAIGSVFGYITREAIQALTRLVWRSARGRSDRLEPTGLPVAAPVLCGNRRRTSPEEFSEMLASELARRETAEPRGAISPAAASDIANRRSFYEIRAAHSPTPNCGPARNRLRGQSCTKQIRGFQVSCLHRFIYVKPVADLNAAMKRRFNARLRFHGRPRCPEIAWGRSRRLLASGRHALCPLGRMQDPSLAWRHDGARTCRLVTWWIGSVPNSKSASRRSKPARGACTMKMELRKTSQFEAAHLFAAPPESHKCRRLHGHSFKARSRCWATAIRSSLGPGFTPKSASVSNDLGTIGSPVFERGRWLGKPTSERIAVWIWERSSRGCPC